MVSRGIEGASESTRKRKDRSARRLRRNERADYILALCKCEMLAGSSLQPRAKEGMQDVRK